MKVLVATAQTQGLRGNDFNWCIEGELVMVGLVCAADRRSPDGKCGCGRAFAGLNSHRATTTAKVKDVELTPSDYVEALRSSLAQQGWPSDKAAEVAACLAQVAGSWPVGTIVERRLDKILVRAMSAPSTRPE